MAAVQQLTLSLRADFVAWLEEEAKQRSQELQAQGAAFNYTAADIAGPLLEEAIERIRAKDRQSPKD